MNKLPLRLKSPMAEIISDELFFFEKEREEKANDVTVLFPVKVAWSFQSSIQPNWTLNSGYKRM